MTRDMHCSSRQVTFGYLGKVYGYWRVQMYIYKAYIRRRSGIEAWDVGYMNAKVDGAKGLKWAGKNCGEGSVARTQAQNSTFLVGCSQ